MAQSRNDVGKELTINGLLLNPLNLGTVELVSFNESLEPIKHLVPQLDDFGFAALAWAESQTFEEGISSDIAAALNLYTREWINREDSLYFILNNALRTADRQVVKPFLSFLRLLFEGFNSLPRYTTLPTVWRGMSDCQILPSYQKGKKVVWWGCSSCSTDMDAVKAFLDGKTNFLFNIHTTNTFDISTFSSFPRENEVLLPPGSYLEIINVMTMDRLTIVEMKEISNSPFLRCPKTVKVPVTSKVENETNQSMQSPIVSSQTTNSTAFKVESTPPKNPTAFKVESTPPKNPINNLAPEELPPGVDPDEIVEVATALYDYTHPDTSTQDFLCFKKGDKFYVLPSGPELEGWKIAINVKGEKGFVPGNFLITLKAAPTPKKKPLPSPPDIASGITPEADPQPEEPNPSSSSSLAEVQGKSSSAWSSAKPANNDVSENLPPGVNPNRIVEVAIALYDYTHPDTSAPDFLCFKAGDKFYLFESGPEFQGWKVAINVKGEKGFVPGNYLQISAYPKRISKGPTTSKDDNKNTTQTNKGKLFKKDKNKDKTKGDKLFKIGKK